MSLQLLRLFLLLIVVAGVGSYLEAGQSGTEPVVVARGWHPWYEVKADPEDSKNLILCGSLWDSDQNAFHGFVYASSDHGESWKKTLEDADSKWVSEQSCAFGPKHMAYFISETSRVIDGDALHHKGMTRLFVSSDAGQHWTATTATAWADASSSAVSRTTGDLLTFFQYPGTLDYGDRLGVSSGRTIGLLVFSPDGKRILGPFFSPDMRERGYRGVYPAGAVSLKDGTVVALYGGLRADPAGQVQDLGLVRVERSASPSPTFTVITTLAEPRTAGFWDSSLVYDDRDDRLYLVYCEDAQEVSRLMMATSNDGGRTWTKGVPLRWPGGQEAQGLHASLAAGPNGTLSLLWANGANWFFSTVKDGVLTGQPGAALHTTPVNASVMNDSLWTYFFRSGGIQPEGYYGAAPSITMSVRALGGKVWRSSGLVASGERFVGVFIAADGEDDKLYSVALPLESAGNGTNRISRAATSEQDVTDQVALLLDRHGSAQSFDNATGTLSIDVRLENRGNRPIRIPIHMCVDTLTSGAGKVKVLNADNGVDGQGAVWDLSRIVVGNEIPPQAVTYNTFTLMFHIDIEHGGLVATPDLLNLRAKILCCAAAVSKGSTVDKSR